MTDTTNAAACRDADGDLFTPEHPTPSTVTAGLAFCDVCPMVDECRDLATDLPGGVAPYGLWGGIWHQMPARTMQQLHDDGWSDSRIGRLVGLSKWGARWRRQRSQPDRSAA